jgi:hypothetical protein
MIGRMDEYLIHQTETTIDHVASSDFDWQDRFYFNFLDRAGTFAATLGYGVRPNRNTADGFFRVAHEKKVYAVNFSRPLNHDREIVRAGSLAIEVVEPLKIWRLTLDEKATGINLELEFTGRSTPYEFKPIFHRSKGRVVWNQVHYTQAGSYNGTVKIAGKKVKDLFGIRDRSWGMRDMQQIDLWIWVSANFDDYWLTAWHSENARGRVICSDGAISHDRNDEKAPLELTEHEFMFDGNKRIPTRARYLLADAHGKSVEVQARTVGTVFHPFTSGIVDISDPAQLQSLDASSVIFGLVQEFRVGNDVGYGLTECLVAGGSEKYKDHWPARTWPNPASGTDAGR